MEYPLQRPEPGKWASAAFSVLMHALLLGALFWGVQWQRRTPEPVSVELVRAAPAPMAEPRPEPEAVKPPPPAPKPAEVKAPEPKPVVKPDIALKEPEKKKPEKKPEPPKPEASKPEKKPETKPQPEAPKQSAQDRRLEEELRKAQDVQARSQQQQNEDRIRNMLNNTADLASKGRAEADWGARIKQKVKSNFSRPLGLAGDPKLVFKIQLLPTGDILGDPQLVSNSGDRNLEESVRRAILKSSPLPKPEKSEVFQREINLTFYPTRDEM